jgi:hypothetical protein
MAEKIEHAELEGIARAFMANSLGGPGSEVSEQRERNLRAYAAQPEGDFAPPEIEDRSQYVSSDVADVVDGMLPQILDVFVSDDKAIDCKPTKPGPNSDAIAKQVTGFLNHLFYTRNEGLNVLYDWLMDAALQKVGFVKVWVEEQAEDSKQTYEGQPPEVLQLMLSEGMTLEGEPQQDERGLTFTVVDESRRKVIRCESVPPHEMRVDGNAKYGKEPAAIGEVRPRRRFELEEMGLDLSDVGGESDDDASGERAALLGESDDDTNYELHDSHKLYEYAELYMQLDADGDGVAEWVQLCLVNGTLKKVEQTDGHPYGDLCLMPLAHAYFGNCPADRAYTIQKEQTNLTRSLVDNVYFATNKRTYVNTDASVNIGDLLDNRPGGMVRGKGKPSDAFAEIPTSPIPQTAWQLKEALAVSLEQRTGFTRYSQGMDADSLNKTATGVKIITAKSDVRLRLMTRFAAQALKKVFGKMLKLATKHLDREEWYEVNGAWQMVKPSEWRDQFNITTKVGLGHGTQEQQGQAVMAMVPLQQMGVQMGVVRPEHIANTIRTFATSQGFKNPDEFADAQPTGLPSPEQFKELQAKVQQDMQAASEQIQQLTQENTALKGQVQNKQADTVLKAGELQLDARELALREQEAEANFALKARDSARNDAGLQLKGAQAAHQAQSQDVDSEQSEAIAALQQQVAWLIQILTQQPAADAGTGMDAPAAPNGGF